MKTIFILTSILSVVSCDVSHLPIEAEDVPPPPPRPYAFGYAAGRFPGHIDRTHSEVSDGAGVIHGSYSYVDPRHQIRTVKYTADKAGFHPILNNYPPPLPEDSPIVAAAKDRHMQLYAAIANAHHEAHNNFVIVPSDSATVQKAKEKHFDLYQKIAEEHARIAAERGAAKAEYEATAEPNTLKDY